MIDLKSHVLHHVLGDGTIFISSYIRYVAFRTLNLLPTKYWTMDETVHKLQMKSTRKAYTSTETSKVMLPRFPSLNTNPVLLLGLLNVLPDPTARLGAPFNFRTTSDSI